MAQSPRRGVGGGSREAHRSHAQRISVWSLGSGSMRAGKWVERFLLLTGIVAVDVWIWSRAGAVLYQRWEERAFNREAQTPKPQNAEESRPEKSSGPLGRLVIPRLNLHAMVGEGTGEDTLSLALGHIPSTALPGEDGNVGVAGHRDTIFRSLRDIRKNDLILFESRRGTYSYRVEGM